MTWFCCFLDQTEIGLLRSEVAHLKSLLLAHKDCPVTLAQRKLMVGGGEVVNPGKHSLNLTGSSVNLAVFTLIVCNL